MQASWKKKEGLSWFAGSNPFLPFFKNNLVGATIKNVKLSDLGWFHVNSFAISQDVSCGKTGNVEVEQVMFRRGVAPEKVLGIMRKS
jgi:hypothetical protein